jgi:hypothetical protein
MSSLEIFEMEGLGLALIDANGRPGRALSSSSSIDRSRERESVQLVDYG